MAAKYPKAATHTHHHVSLPEFERALQLLTQQVAEQKLQLADTFRHILQMVSQREAELVAHLDAILASISAKIEERRASLEQLAQNKEDTERKLQANRLNEFLQRQLSGIQTEMDRILSEQILFPRVSLSCDEEAITTQLNNKCLIDTKDNSYTFRIQPVWHGVKRGEEMDELLNPKAISIDSSTQLVYVAEYDTRRIQVFTSEGKHHSTINNQQLDRCLSMKIHGDHIYLSTRSPILIKINKKGVSIKTTHTDTAILGLYIEGAKLYTCAKKSLTVQVFDFNLKPDKKIQLRPLSFDESTTPRDVIINKDQLFVLFSYSVNNNHPDPIQIFWLDGTLIHSLVPGNLIKNAYYFCMDSNQNILVSDCLGHCIRIFSPDRFLLQSIGREGEIETGELNNPQGITVDPKGRIVVVDGKDDNTLQAF